MLNSFLQIVIVSLLLISCRQQNAARTDLLLLTRQKFAAMNRHQVDSIAVLYAEDAVIESPNMEKAEIGQQGARNVYGRYFTSSPDLVYKVSSMQVNDSSVTVEYASSGTMKHLENAAPAYMLGKAYSLKSCSILRFRNNRIISDRSYFDQVAFLQQVGFFEQH